ncbi:MAG: hypothetical protein BAJALOKI2v1_400005 [Promethearchaeota archaeon]|nr:MAG: hypothetical protein BAJALOKI2v1_400005 [Candidatus Lokiarchaeota archaeon]
MEDCNSGLSKVYSKEFLIILNTFRIIEMINRLILRKIRCYYSIEFLSE